jgi:hypothetical protein
MSQYSNIPGGNMPSRFITLRRLLSSLLLTVILFSGTPAAMAQGEITSAPTSPAPDPEKQKAIRTLLELSGVIEVMKDAVNTTIDQIGAVNPDIPAEFLKRLKARFKPEELVIRMIPVYDKHFTKDEINQLIAFYQTPVGRKMVASQLSIQRESGAIGEKYGEELGMQVVREMEKEGKLPKSNNPDR